MIVGFNEFCAPSLEETLDQAVLCGADRIVVVTPMMTPGGEHAEERHPKIAFAYAWPFEVNDVARFLAMQIEQIPGS